MLLMHVQLGLRCVGSPEEETEPSSASATASAREAQELGDAIERMLLG